jgi:FAD/FMN-containing dehydrogenase
MTLSAQLQQNLASVLGSGNLLTDAADLAKYGRCAGNPVLLEGKAPAAAAVPLTIEQVKETVRLLAGEKVPMVPWSCGLDHHGNAVPAVEGAVILDVSEMRQLVELYPTPAEGMYAVVEPGVSFAQLQQELDGHGLRVPMPARHSSQASILSTYVNKHPSWRSSWQGLYSFPLLLPTVELVTADGQEFRSGAFASGIGTISAVGMGLDRLPLGSLGTSGVMTKAVVILEKQPAIRRLYFCRFDELEDAVNAAKRLLRYSSMEIGEAHAIMNDVCLAGLLAESRERFDITRRQLPAWTYAVCVSGPDEEWVEIQEKHLRQVGAGLRNEFVTELSGVKDAGAELLDEMIMPTRIERLGEYLPHTRLEFHTTSSRIPRYDGLIREALAAGGREQKPGVFVLPIEQARTHYVEYDLFLDPEQPEEMRSILEALYPALLDAGAGFARSDYPLLNRLLRERAPEYYGLMDRLKEQFDPDNVFNPGRVF